MTEQIGFKGGDPSENGKKGGVASGLVRRKNRDVAKTMDRHLQTQLPPAQLEAYLELGYKVPVNGIVTKMDLMVARNIEKTISTGQSKDVLSTSVLARYLDIEGVPVIPDDETPVQNDGDGMEIEIDDTMPTIINVQVLSIEDVTPDDGED